jgi:hypothetical protein
VYADTIKKKIKNTRTRLLSVLRLLMTKLILIKRNDEEENSCLGDVVPSSDRPFKMCDPQP